MRFTLPRRWQDALYAGLFGVWAIVFLWTEQAHDLTFPVPWPDEGSFLWPALAFRDHLTLYAPELNPAREIFWMPPGFMVLEGTIFKLVTFSLGRARFLSALYFVGAIFCLAAQLRGSRVRFGHALIIGAFSFAPIFQLVGNTARMESLVLLVACAGFLLLDRGKAAGLGVLAAGPLVHPNGVFALAAGIVYFLFAFRGRRKPSRADVAVFAAVALCWFLFALHLGVNWSAVVEDMTIQLKWKRAEAALNGPSLGRIFHPFRVIPELVLVLASVPALRLGAKVGAMTALGLSFLVGSGFTVGWLYEMYVAFATILAAMVVLELALVLAERFIPGRVPLAAGALSVLLSVGALAISRHPFLMWSTRRATLPAAPGSVYCSKAEHAAIAAFIKRSHPHDGPVVLQFLPDSDGLLFEDLRSPSMHFITQVIQATRPDMFILHYSPWFPELLRDVELADFAMRNNVTHPLPYWETIASNVSSGRWVTVRRDGPELPWY
jgi:hypothetical protein